jgi:hypothetical protein
LQTSKGPRKGEESVTLAFGAMEQLNLTGMEQLNLAKEFHGAIEFVYRNFTKKIS